MARQNRFACDKHNGRNKALAVMFIMSLAGLLYATANITEPLTLSVGCRECHYTPAPIIKTLAQYKRAMKQRAMDKDILADLISEVRP